MKERKRKKREEGERRVEKTRRDRGKGNRERERVGKGRGKITNGTDMYSICLTDTNNINILLQTVLTLPRA